MRRTCSTVPTVLAGSCGGPGRPAPSIIGAVRASTSGTRFSSAGEIGRTLLIAVPAIALPFVIRAAVVEGVEGHRGDHQA